MAVGYNPRAITDGLVLALDAGNPKNYNAGISTNWTDKVGGNNGTLVGGTYHNDGPFVGAGYVDFNSSGDYLSIADSADLELDTNTTIELFIKFNTIPTVATYIFGKTNGYWLAYDSTAVGGVADRFTFAIYNGSSWSGTTNASGGFLPVVNTWYHIAVVKEGTSTKLYVDGTLYGSGTFSGTPADNSNVVSINYSGGTIDADISNVRFIRGTALYTSNFTPPTKPLTAVTNTTLLTCQGNTITDASSSAHTITANGDISLTKEPFAGAGGVQGGGTTSDYLSVSASGHSDFSLDGDFTTEWWHYRAAANANNGYMWTIGDSNTSTGLELYWGSTGSSLKLFTNGGANSVTATAATGWHHYAVVRSGNTIKVYYDGTEGASVSNTNTFSGNVTIGGEFYNGGITGGMHGPMSQFRLVKGTALYTSAFTPPAEPLTAVTNTKLLTCQGQNIKDASSSAHTITPNGDVKATIVSSAFEFDGSNDYITTNTNANFTLGASEDFALEWWEYWTLTSPTTMHGHVGVFDNGCLHIASYTGSQQFAMHYGTWRYFANAYVVPFKWTHYVVTGQSQNIRFYQNGELKSTNTGTAYTVSGTPGATKYFEVGRNTYGSTGYSKMKASSVKFYKGKALTAAEVEQNYNATKGRYA